MLPCDLPEPEGEGKKISAFCPVNVTRRWLGSAFIRRPGMCCCYRGVRAPVDDPRS